MTFIDKDNFENCKGIYAIMCFENGCFYVGQTRQTFMRRFYEHSERLTRNIHSNSYLQRTFNKYGSESFIFFVVQCVNENDDIDKIEKKYVEIAKEHFITCANVLSGGEEGHKDLGELNRIRLTGTKLPIETRLKMSKTRTGVSRSKSVMKKIVNARQEKYLCGKFGCNKSLTPAVVIAIKKLLTAQCKHSDISHLLNVSIPNIQAIASERAWKFIAVDEFTEWRNSKQIKRSPRQSRAKLQQGEGVTTIQ